MPTRNAGSFLAKAVDSIVRQTLSDLELLIVDDGSTDGALDDLISKGCDARIRVFRNPRNLGIGASYAFAIPLCESPWIALMDSDDIAHPMRLKFQLEALAADPSLDAVATAMEFIDSEDRVTGHYKSFHTPEEIRAYSIAVMPVPHPTLMGRSEMFRKISYRSEIPVAQDYDMVLRALDRGYKIGSISLPLYKYRRHSASTFQTKRRAHVIASCAFQICSARRRSGLPEQFEDAAITAAAMIARSDEPSTVLRRYARDCHRQGFVNLAVVNSALSLRYGPSPIALAFLVRYLAVAALRDRGSRRPLAVGAIKGAIGALLRQADGSNTGNE
jgi:glycosyltransferase involved in cell wall biosynthesis